MEWPPQSPDLNPIEQLWDHLDSVLRKNPQTNEENTWKFLEKAWSEIAKETLTTYIYSIFRSTIYSSKALSSSH